MLKLSLLLLLISLVPRTVFAAEAVPDGFVVWELKGVDRIGGVGPMLIPQEASDKMKELGKFNDKIDRLERQKFDFHHASSDDDLSELERKNAAKNYDKTVEKIAALEEERAKIFGPNAEKLADKVARKASWLGRQWTDLKSRIYEVNAKNKSDWGKEHPRSLPTPNKKFLDAQAAVSEAADEFLAPMKKVGIKGKVKGFRRAGVAAAAGAAVMVGVDAMMSDGAKADELHPQDLQKNETNQDEERSEVEIGTLGE